MDASRAALDAARANAGRLQVSATFVLADATNPPRARRPAGLVFLDPPYDRGLAAPALSALAAAGWLGPGAIVSLELGAREARDLALPSSFERLDLRRYGRAHILLLRAGS